MVRYKLNLFFRMIMFIILVVIMSNMILSVGTLSSPSMCCEKTKNGGWCINDNESNCDASYKMAPASCESTSFCRLGTCYDSSEGICYDNTPQRVCDEMYGTWDPRPLSEVPQCQLGCCIIADQAAFVPLVRCKKLSTYFGVAFNYKTDVETEMDCIALANSQDVGACVYEKDFQRYCEFTTRAECGASEGVISTTSFNRSSSEKRFFKDYLCSAEELNTICAKQATVGCYQGKVYWFDSCGNRENVFSSDRIKSWNNGRVLDPDEVCSPNDGTDPNCGNCEYLLGSRCEAKSGLLPGSGAFCQRTVCKDRWGNIRLNGESWCVNDGFTGNGLDKVGSRYYREVCIDGEIRVEPCADYRNEVCYETSMKTSKGSFSVAACRVNRWQDCIGITDKNKCLNGDKRDCMWINSPVGLLIGGANAPESQNAGYTSDLSSGLNSGSQDFGSNDNFNSGFSNPTFTGAFLFSKEERLENETTITNRPGGVCVPRFPPGLKFWDSSSESVCNLVSARCVVQFKKKAFSDWKCTENCECLDSDWALEMNRVCTSLGDCGAYVNYIGKLTDGGYEFVIPSGKRAFSAEDEAYIRSGFGTGKVVLDSEEEIAGSITKKIFESLR